MLATGVNDPTNVPTYGGTITTAACTLVGNDERNGRINPALEVNDDEIDLTEMKRRKAKATSNRTTASAQGSSSSSIRKATQSQTTL